MVRSVLIVCVWFAFVLLCFGLLFGAACFVVGWRLFGLT